MIMIRGIFTVLSSVYLFLLPTISAASGGAPPTYEYTIPVQFEFRLFNGVDPMEPTPEQLQAFKGRMDEWWLEGVDAALDELELDSFTTEFVCSSFDAAAENPIIVAYDAVATLNDRAGKARRETSGLQRIMAHNDMDFHAFITKAVWPPNQRAGGILWEVQWILFVSDANRPHPCMEESASMAGEGAVTKGYKAPPRETTNDEASTGSISEASTTFEASPSSVEASSSGVPMFLLAFLWTVMPSILILAQII